MKIEVHCDDGTDRHCDKVVEIDLPFSGLAPDDVIVQWTVERGRRVVESVRVSPPNPEWVKRNDASLAESSLSEIEESGYFEISYDDLEHVVCDPCGSDQTYDDEGNNISAL